MSLSGLAQPVTPTEDCVSPYGGTVVGSWCWRNEGSWVKLFVLIFQQVEAAVCEALGVQTAKSLYHSWKCGDSLWSLCFYHHLFSSFWPSVLLISLAFFFVPSPGLRHPQQAVMPSSLAPYIRHAKEIQSLKWCLSQFFICQVSVTWISLSCRWTVTSSWLLGSSCRSSEVACLPLDSFSSFC